MRFTSPVGSVVPAVVYADVSFGELSPMWAAAMTVGSALALLLVFAWFIYMQTKHDRSEMVEWTGNAIRLMVYGGLIAAPFWMAVVWFHLPEQVETYGDKVGIVLAAPAILGTGAAALGSAIAMIRKL